MIGNDGKNLPKCKGHLISILGHSKTTAAPVMIRWLQLNPTVPMMPSPCRTLCCSARYVCKTFVTNAERTDIVRDYHSRYLKPYSSKEMSFSTEGSTCVDSDLSVTTWVLDRRNRMNGQEGQHIRMQV